MVLFEAVHYSSAILSCCVWIYLTIGRGWFWRLPQPPSPQLRSGLARSTPTVVAIIPARNEADVIDKALGSLIRDEYPGLVQIVVVDDHSTDSTIHTALQTAQISKKRVCVLSSPPVPEGWTGKMWALFQGVQQTADLQPDYFLFSDADIVRSSGSLRSLVTRAEVEGLELVSMLPTQDCSRFTDRALLPAFAYYFFMLYPPNWVRDPSQHTAAAAGGNVLVRARAMAKIGGIAAIRDQLIDDCALAREIKRIGKVRLGWTTDARIIRRYGAFGPILTMISRNAFYQLRHSLMLLFFTVAALTITFLLPPILVVPCDWSSVIAFLAWLLMCITYIPTLRFHSVPLVWAPLLPFTTLFYIVATIHSAIQYYRGRGGEWKGRAQDTAAIRSPST